MVGTGLRERKKQATRRAISDVATRLFIKRGFDNVTIAEVAKAADVSVQTVFNYFATKEDLFFDRGEEVVKLTSRIVRDRRPGESVLGAIERALREMAANNDTLTAGARHFFAAVDASAALRLRERVLLEESEECLARQLAEESGAAPDDPEPRVVAALVSALEWILIREFRARLRRGDSPPTIRRALTRALDEGLTRLEKGIGKYGKR
jgi:AcrR family transcriptional regulator